MHVSYAGISRNQENPLQVSTFSLVARAIAVIVVFLFFGGYTAQLLLLLLLLLLLSLCTLELALVWDWPPTLCSDFVNWIGWIKYGNIPRLKLKLGIIISRKFRGEILHDCPVSVWKEITFRGKWIRVSSSNSRTETVVVVVEVIIINRCGGMNIMQN